MGILAQGMGFGSAGQSAGSALQWGQDAGALNAGGAALSAFGGYQSAMFASQVANNNATIARQNADTDVQAGSYEESASRLRTGLMIGQQKAAQAANGVDVNVGSAPAVRASTAAVGSMDALAIRYNAAKQAANEEAHAASLGEQSKIDRSAAIGALAGGAFKVSSSLLSTASSLGSKWNQNQLAFGS